ncbi:hypothetical protein PVK06_024209 [Gossypium arboreum]|uniref:Reverse transcriptase n=1 Tax=Gossypium arboreum TaxID=29729 RepID=A0ABR0PDA4_GOSAR|nr:hypothetical protein PVK06_024209 [Gossypium arboreum]
MFSYEKRGGRLRMDENMAHFRKTLEKCGLNEIGFFDRWFTGERGKLSKNNVRERLDRRVANQTWWETFLRYFVKHLTHSISDHCPLLVDLGIENSTVCKERSF